MKKQRTQGFLRTLSILAAAVLLLLSGCGDGDGPVAPGSSTPTPGPEDNSSQSAETPAPVESYTVTAMYIPLGRKDPPESYLMFDQKDDSAFTLGDFPQDIRDIAGDPITQAGLKKGNLLEIDFGPDSVVLEIYPSINHGATQIRVVAEGKPEDADRYQDQVAQFYDPQPQNPPVLQFDYEEMFLESAVIHGGTLTAACYEWHYEDLEGNPQVVNAEQPPVLLRDNLDEVELEEPVALSLYFGGDPLEWTVLRWKEDFLGAKNAPDGEEVELMEGERDGKVILDAEPGWVYQATAAWEESWVEYAFHLQAAPHRDPPALDAESTPSVAAESKSF